MRRGTAVKNGITMTSEILMDLAYSELNGNELVKIATIGMSKRGIRNRTDCQRVPYHSKCWKSLLSTNQLDH